MIYAIVLNDADADDLTQEVFIRVVRSLDGFRSQAQFSTWLHRISINTIRTFLGRQNRHPSTSGAVLEESADCRLSTPAEAAMAKEADGKLDGEIGIALGSLKPKLRAAVMLVIMQDMSPREAARVEGCATATMHWRIHKARTILKEKLKGYPK